MNRDDLLLRLIWWLAVVVAILLVLAMIWVVTTPPPALALDSVSFTTPDREARGLGDCGDISTRVLWEPVLVRLYASRQSPTWADSSAVLLGSPAGFSRLWPIVRAEAAAVVLRAKPEAPGAQDSMRMPAGPWLACWLVVVKSNQLESCPSRKLQTLPATVSAPMDAPEALTVAAEPLSLAPSPAGDAVTVTLGAGEGESDLRVFDLSGRQMLAMGWPFAVHRRVALDLSGWPVGLYFVRVRLGEARHMRRLVVVR